MMHQRHQMTQAQQNLWALGGSVMMSAAPTAGMSNATSAMGVEQMNNMTTLQKMQSESPRDFIQQQQLLHQKQRIDVGSRSAPADLTDDQLKDIYGKQEFLKKTHHMHQLKEIVHQLLTLSIRVEYLLPQPFYNAMLKIIRDAVKNVSDLVKVLDYHVDTLPINLKDKLHRFEELVPEVVKHANLVFNQGLLFLK